MLDREPFAQVLWWSIESKEIVVASGETVPIMEESAESSKSESGAPIFSEDVPCPRCGYNLRGLVAPICPECGFVFDPKQVRQDLIRARWRMPVGWVLGHILPHPAGFWTHPLALEAKAPSVWQLVAMASIGAAIAPVGMLILLTGLVGVDKEIAIVLFMLWAASLAVAMVSAGLHELLCRLALSAAGQPRPAVEVARFTRHSAAWLVVVLPSCVACLLMLLIVITEGGLGAAPRGLRYLFPGVCILGLLGGSVGTMCWGVSLYTGARAVSRVSGRVALWCVLCCPLLWVSVPAVVTIVLGVGVGR